MTAVIAHRGGALLWPENSRMACRQCILMGVDEIQLDLHTTSAGEFVVIHDATLDRTTNTTGRVDLMTPATRSAIILAGTADETLPLLEELLEIIRPSAARLRLELKRSDPSRGFSNMQALWALLQRERMLDRTILCAFALDDMMLCLELPALGHVWMLGAVYLADRTPAHAITTSAAAGITGLALRWNASAPEFAPAVRAAGLRLDLFGCNDELAIRSALAARPDGLSTDRPDLAQIVIAETN